MPGDFRLGCLVGSNQSFDRPLTAGFPTGGWAAISGQDSVSLLTTPVYSSAQSIRLDVYSSASTERGIYYNYSAERDAQGLPSITTHTLISKAWAAVVTNSADLHLEIVTGVTAGTSPSFPIGGTLTRREVTIHTIQTQLLRLDFQFLGATANDHAAWIDTVVTEIDPITLYPEYDFLERGPLRAARHRTQGGVLHTYQWTRHFAYQVPLRFLSNSHADLINWWWVNGYPLAFTLDTSDQAALYTVKIVNETQPIGSKIKPYVYGLDGWAGVLELESLDQGSLVY